MSDSIIDNKLVLLILLGLFLVVMLGLYFYFGETMGSIARGIFK